MRGELNMDDYFSQFLEERRKKEKAEQSIKSLSIIVLVLFVLVVMLTIRCFFLLVENGDLKYEISCYQEQDING